MSDHFSIWMFSYFLSNMGTYNVQMVLVGCFKIGQLLGMEAIHRNMYSNVELVVRFPFCLEDLNLYFRLVHLKTLLET